MKKLTEAQRDELINYLLEGNSPRDLADLFLDNAIPLKVDELIKEVKEQHQISGDYPHVSVMKI